MCLACGEVACVVVASVPLWRKIWRCAKGLWGKIFAVREEHRDRVAPRPFPNHAYADDGWDSRCVVCGDDPVPMRKMRYVFPGILIEVEEA